MHPQPGRDWQSKLLDGKKKPWPVIACLSGITVYSWSRNIERCFVTRFEADALRRAPWALR
ncbi:hypothetical protein HBI81_205280 [Parastagonospora nodorum]|nr:hypothetical protein HBH42_210800 [Parastagonospora nodorum]KAH5252951.1 hypothetical protein HBI70_198540 [Parastagonospora nodorum]KAH6327318.1 hypothetical protein HBI37_202170 [Parastagonospora nodorum]KAH6341643.1 hypothetical protein HBI36_189500 [Parastagonospora nodorum]KAH6388039.1 hypothetical protein HBI60_200370 [Parastagonospora nodorum]